MITLLTSVQWKELSPEEATCVENPAAWHSRQQLRAFYFTQEQGGFETIPTQKKSGAFKLTIVAANWRTADVAG